MSVVKSYFILLLVFVFGKAMGQTNSDTLLAKDNVMIPLPTVSVNFGINSAFSDVKLSPEGPSPFKQFGFQLTITQRVTKFLNASLNLYTGTIYGEEQIGLTNLNFRTTLFSQHINVEYNFYPFLKPNENGRQLIRPYVGFGLGVLSFRSKGDLQDTKGRSYHYWSDDAIYAEEEGTVAPSEATPLERDFSYESDLRDANLDGLRKYAQTAFSLPLNAGVRFQVSKNVGLNAAFAYSFNFTDMLDNISQDGVGDRKGSGGFDNHLYGSIGLSVFLGTTKPTAKPTRFKEQLAEAEPSDISKTEQAQAKNAPESQDSTELVDPRDSQKPLEPQALQKTEKSQEPEQLDVAENISREESLIGETNTERKDLNSEERLEEVNTARKTIARLQRESTALQTTIDALRKEIGQDSKLRKKHIESVQQLVADKTSTHNEIEELRKQLFQLNSSTPTVSERAQSATVGGTGLTPKTISSKEEAIALLDTISTELTQYQALLIEERVAVKNQELALNQLGVVLAKIRLMEKIQTKNENQPNTSARSSISENEVKETMVGLNAELDKLTSDTLLVSLIGTSEISALRERVRAVHPEAVPSHPATEEKSTALAESERSAAPSVTTKSKVDGAAKSVDDIENTPPKETGGFMWADINNDGWISPDEVLHFIDLLFDGEAVRTVEDIQNLIDYYFDQE